MFVRNDLKVTPSTKGRKKCLYNDVFFTCNHTESTNYHLTEKSNIRKFTHSTDHILNERCKFTSRATAFSTKFHAEHTWQTIS